jgi:hypothetical protein
MVDCGGSRRLSEKPVVVVPLPAVEANGFP